MNSENHDSTPDIIIQQLRLSRRLGVGVGVLIALVGGFIMWQGTWTSPGWPSFGLGALAALFGIVAAIRIPRSRVVLRQDEMVVHGQLWSRTVPRKSITSITPWPIVRWTDPRGREHSTPVTVLNAGGGAFSEFTEHALEGRNTLREWAGVDGASVDDAR